MAVQDVTAAPARRLALAACALALGLALGGNAMAQTQDKPPSTFAPVIGAALLCHDHLDNAYFYAWLKTHFGPAYKHEGGAWWFRTGETRLWGAPVEEVLVSDDTSEWVFVGAVADMPPDELEQSIRKAAGVAHRAADASRYPLRVSVPGSTIAYYNAKSKIYCAKFKPLPPRR